ncbi:MAG: choice-of-anchor B family protein [Sphingobacteriales bacterium]|nr:choice-of-anchor B family protein [Sphingobacteriales bacterium]
MKHIYLLKYYILISISVCINLSAQQNVNLGSQLSYTQSSNDIWGYTDTNGNEYALVGTQTGLSIVDVSNPTSPVERHFVAGPNNTWRDIHTWSHYAYITTESTASGGLLVIDLAYLPDSISTSYTDLGIGYYSAHTLYIDDSEGIGYLFGAKSTQQGNATFFIDIAANPISPTYMGKYSAAYVHDGYVRNDTMWTCEIYAGRFAVVNVSNKLSPSVLATQTTPYAFTHTAWLSDDSHYLFITDEKNAAPVVAYDVSDIYDIKEVDRYRTKPVSDSLAVAHNDYVRGNFLVSSYYTAGITTADITYPYNIIETGNYDTAPLLSGGGFNGCWGVYPYFASGKLLATDRQNGLFVLLPTYTSACWLEGTVRNALNNAPIANAQIQIMGIEAGYDRSDFGGFYATGTAIANTYQVVATAAGYDPDTTTLTLTNGVLATYDFDLVPTGYCAQTPANPHDIMRTDQTLRLAWQGTNNAQQYYVQYRALGDSNWQNAPATTTDSITISSLTPCTAYEWRVQSQCDFDKTSAFSVIDTASTSAPNPEWASPATPITCTDQIALDAYVTGYAGGTWSGGDYVNNSGWFDATGLEQGEYPVTYTVSVGSCTVSETHDITVSACPTAVHCRLILGGAYQATSGLMRNNLSANLLPTAQPYNTAPWYYQGNETIANPPADAVDWILVELRPVANIEQITAQTAVLLHQDGTLTAANGASGAQFSGVAAGTYYIVVRHRNHLAVISQTPVSLPNTASNAYDVTAQNAAMGNNQTYFVGNGDVYALRPGDFNANGIITVEDYNLYTTQIAQINTYLSGDLTLDGNVTVHDFNQYLPQASIIGISVVRY